MKAISITVISLVLSLTLFAQPGKKGVPDIVVAAFQKKFPSAQGITWEKENGNFEAEFRIAKSSQSALFDKSGMLLESETEITKDKLPVGARTYIAQHYKSAKIKECAKITDVSGVVTYEAEIKGKDVIFDSKGNFLKTVQE
ncbi:MAG: hypothetical protein EOP49_21715 [Sphingobacteriales bacterium]|nr:MAG: hypothetical protein EOP49_21715 [Sphingobacteriales bacterium]